MLILYTTEDGRSRIQLRADEKIVWLTQLDVAELFDATKQTVSLHVKNLFEDEELDPAATVKESLTVQSACGRNPTAGKSSVVRSAWPAEKALPA